MKFEFFGDVVQALNERLSSTSTCRKPQNEDLGVLLICARRIRRTLSRTLSATTRKHGSPRRSMQPTPHNLRRYSERVQHRWSSFQTPSILVMEVQSTFTCVTCGFDAQAPIASALVSPESSTHRKRLDADCPRDCGSVTHRKLQTYPSRLDGPTLWRRRSGAPARFSCPVQALLNPSQFQRPEADEHIPAGIQQPEIFFHDSIISQRFIDGHMETVGDDKFATKRVATMT